MTFAIQEILTELSHLDRVARLRALQTSKAVVRARADVDDIRFAGDGQELTPKGLQAMKIAQRCVVATRTVEELADRGATEIQLGDRFDLDRLERFLRNPFAIRVCIDTDPIEPPASAGGRIRTT